MTPELKKKYAEFKDKIFGLSGVWATRHVSYQATDKMFVAKYEPEYPMPSDKDRIIVYNLKPERYMLFGQIGVSCKFNGNNFDELRNFLTQEKLDEFGTEE